MAADTFDPEGFENLKQRGIQKAVHERKMTQSGQALVSLMRATKEDDLRALESAVCRMYEKGELHEVRAACDRPVAEVALRYVAQAYRMLTECAWVRIEPQFGATYKVAAPLPARAGDAFVSLVAIHVRTNIRWADIKLETLQTIADEASQSANESLKGVQGFAFDFGGRASMWFSPGFMDNLKLHVMFELFMRRNGLSRSTEAVWEKFGMGPMLGYVLETQRTEPGDKDQLVSLVVLGTASSTEIGQEVNLFTASERLMRALAGSQLANQGADGSSCTEEKTHWIANVGGFADVYEAFIYGTRKVNLTRIVGVAAERTEGAQCYASAAWVGLDDPNRYCQSLVVGVWRESGAFVYGTSWIMSSLDDGEQAKRDLETLCRDLAIELHWAASSTFDKTLAEQGKQLYPDRMGNWLNPAVQVAGKGATLIKDASWSGWREDAPVSLADLPFPTYVMALGALDVVQRHYQPTVYARIKELLGLTELSLEAVLTRLEEYFPEFRDLACNAPYAALPEDEVLLALRHHWAKAPIIVVKQTLEERLRHTDVGLKVPIGMMVTPYPMCYIHFEGGSPSLTYETDGQEFSLRGVFVHEHRMGFYNKHCARVLELGFIAVSTDLQSLSHLDFSLEFASDDTTFAQAIEAWAHGSDDPESNQESEALEAQLIETVLKVFLYMGSPGAIQAPCEPRKALLANLKGKSESQKLKAQRHLSETYDFILVGPDEAFEVEQQNANGDSTVRPHFRRGHGRHVSYGKGRSQKRMVIFPPVIVNKHLLGSDPTSWPKPKNYRLS